MGKEQRTPQAETSGPLGRVRIGQHKIRDNGNSDDYAKPGETEHQSRVFAGEQQFRLPLWLLRQHTKGVAITHFPSLTQTGVGVEKVRQQKVFSAASMRCRAFFLSVRLRGGWRQRSRWLAEEPHESLDVRATAARKNCSRTNFSRRRRKRRSPI